MDPVGILLGIMFFVFVAVAGYCAGKAVAEDKAYKKERAKFKEDQAQREYESIWAAINELGRETQSSFMEIDQKINDNCNELRHWTCHEIENMQKDIQDSRDFTQDLYEASSARINNMEK